MNEQQHAVDALLRSATDDETATLEQRRATLAQNLTRPIPDDITVAETSLGGRPALRFDTPTTGRPGTLLYLHGGGYVVGSARTHAHLAIELAPGIGRTAFSLDYRLAPEHPFPAAVEDGL